MKAPIKFALTACLSVVLSGPVQAVTFELNSGSFFAHSGGPGTGRGIGLHADSSFSITSLGIFGDLVNESYDVVVFSSTDGHQANSVLASASGIAGGIGNDWNDLPLSFTFNAGDFYTLLWRPTDGNNSWADLDYYNDSALPRTVGPVTLIDGLEGFNAEGGNILDPDLRINVPGGNDNAVPEPASLLLLGSGLAGLAVWQRKRQS